MPDVSIGDKLDRNPLVQSEVMDRFTKDSLEKFTFYSIPSEKTDAVIRAIAFFNQNKRNLLAQHTDHARGFRAFTHYLMRPFTLKRQLKESAQIAEALGELFSN